MKGYLIDTNIILRFLLNDHEQLSKKAYAIFKKAEYHKVKLYINHTTIAEVFWVLTSYYNKPKSQVIDLLVALINLPNIVVSRKKVILKVLQVLAENNIDYIDAYNLVDAQYKKISLMTFDKKLDKIANQNTENLIQEKFISSL